MSSFRLFAGLIRQPPTIVRNSSMKFFPLATRKGRLTACDSRTTVTARS
jgi:hypothetical protein